MITLFYFFRLALHNLRRGGQRVFVALLCIVFGIMAQVAMNMLARSIAGSVEMPAAQLVGGDLSFGRKAEDTLRPEDITQLNALEEQGEISRYTLIAYSNSIIFRSAGSAEMHFVGTGLSIEPEKYPLAGSLAIQEPGNIGLATLLRQAGDVLVTRDVAEEYQLKVGDRILLSNLQTGLPLEGIIRGIASDTPNHQGDKIYYSVATAQKLAGGRAVVNTVIANTAHAETVTTLLDSSGWSVDWSAGQRDARAANLWVLGLRGAGILGLLVSGIGIANTMQVLLRRRQGEIAIWKTLGYRASDMRLIFALEAGLLGLVGSLLGAGLGVFISTGLLEVFRRTSTMLYQWTFSLTPPLVGILVGTLTTVIFAAWAIVVSSQAKPMALLRNEPVNVQQLTGCASASLGLLLAVLFIALTGLVMESLAAGLGVVVCLGVGIASLGAVFSGLLSVCTRILPLRGSPLAQMALKNLRRRGLALVFAMIALFVGIISMSLGLAVAQLSERKIAGGPAGTQAYNLEILASADQEGAIRRAVEAQNPAKVSIGYRTAVESLQEVGRGEPLSATSALLVGRSDPQDYEISGAAWGSRPDGVYVFQGANLKPGSQVAATFLDGTSKVFTVVGSYQVNYRSMNLYPPLGLLMTSEAFNRVARPDSLNYFVQVDSERLGPAAAALGIALPQATVLNLVAYAGRFMRSYQNLYILPIVMSGLALLAGFLLVANSVSLAVLDRRYEMGVLKALGYSRRHILSIFAVEYGLIGLLSTGAGVILVQALLVGLAAASHQSASVVILSFPALVLIALCGVGLTLLTVLGVAWEPTRLPARVVLNEQN